MDEVKNDANAKMKSKETIYLIVIIAAVILLGGGMLWFFQSQSQLQTQTSIVPTPTPRGPITGLTCDQGFYNYVVGKPQVIPGAIGVDTTATQSISCDFSYTDPQGASSSSKVNALLQNITGGKSWRCDDPDKLFPKGKTNFTVAVSDDKGETASCSSSIFLQ